MAGTPFSRDALRAIVAPFEGSEAGIWISVEDAEGRSLASAGPQPPGDGTVSTSAEIRCADGDEVVGRVVGCGASAHIGPVVASLAASLEALVRARDGVDPSAHRLEAELALARRIQRSFVPLTPPELPGYEVASHYEAAYEVGGDFFDVFPLEAAPDELAILIADVSGKGIAAAMVMAFARPLIRAAINITSDPAESLRRTNRIIVDERRSGLFITALCAIVDMPSGSFRLANAGHEPPLIVPGDRGEVRWLEGSGRLLGAFGDLELVECRADLAPGDTVILYTDGVTDARASSGERFGEQRLLEVIDRCRGDSARQTVDSIAAATRAFQGEAPAADDVTIVALRRT